METVRGGRRIWALVRVGEDSTVINGDKVRPYLLLATSYDGSMATTAQFTSIRVVCNNTLTAAVGDRDEPRVRISHIAKFDATTVRQQLPIATSSWEKFLMKAKQLAGTPVGDLTMDKFILDLYRINRYDERAVESARRSKAYTRIIQLFQGEAKGADVADKTLWGAVNAVNAVTQYIDYERRGKTRDTGLDAAWFGEGALLKDRALAMAQERLTA